ncbi:DnaJ domain containing protein [Parasponia andersonii]|uniref:DnaJ domain containing protein n=1 Tax=Parasponia andersonii TaxID=3476 RepID=A0A2P5B6R7_PARAD|nr:DnaJ domain containing protein [Parasponia andersonii]
MNSCSAMKAALFNSKPSCIFTWTALFHSTPVLGRRRRNFWDSKPNYYSKRFRKLHAKENLLRNVGAYADFLFQSWRDENDEDDPTSSRRPSWFRRPHSAKDFRRGSGNSGSQCWGRRDFRICEDEDDVDVETIFRSAFGGNQFYYWSFTNEDQWRNSSRYSRNSWNWRHRIEEEEYENEYECESSESELASHRLALGLSASGPLKLEDVKRAYRTCALKWHPDRHQGSSKAVAEEKFKLCSAAYQSLCDKLAVD